MRLSRLAVLPLLPPPPTKERGVEKKARRCSLHFALAYQSRGVVRRASLLCFGFSTSFRKAPSCISQPSHQRAELSRFPADVISLFSCEPRPSSGGSDVTWWENLTTKLPSCPPAFPLDDEGGTHNFSSKDEGKSNSGNASVSV